MDYDAFEYDTLFKLDSEWVEELEKYYQEEINHEETLTQDKVEKLFDDKIEQIREPQSLPLQQVVEEEKAWLEEYNKTRVKENKLRESRTIKALQKQEDTLKIAIISFILGIVMFVWGSNIEVVEWNIPMLMCLVISSVFVISTLERILYMDFPQYLKESIEDRYFVSDFVNNENDYNKMNILLTEKKYAKYFTKKKEVLCNYSKVVMNKRKRVRVINLLTRIIFAIAVFIFMIIVVRFIGTKVVDFALSLVGVGKPIIYNSFKEYLPSIGNIVLLVIVYYFSWKVLLNFFQYLFGYKKARLQATQSEEEWVKIKSQYEKSVSMFNSLKQV